jgi:plasminogen activator inhibitor 1 RNA-binding protein
LEKKILIFVTTVSPPSRRDRGNRKDVSEPVVESSTERKSNKPEKPGRSEGNGRGRQFDRHSGTGI